MESKYLEQFQKLSELKDCYHIVGDYILVEKIEEKEIKTKGGIIMTPSVETSKDIITAEKPVFCHVLAVGEGFYSEDPTQCPVKLDVNPGDIILIGPMSVTWFKTFGTLASAGSVGVTRESEIKMRFFGKEGYAKVFGILGSSV